MLLESSETYVTLSLSVSGLQRIVLKIINIIDMYGKPDRRIEMGKKIVSGNSTRAQNNGKC